MRSIGIEIGMGYLRRVSCDAWPMKTHKGIRSRTVVDRGRCRNADALGYRNAGDRNIVNVNVDLGLRDKNRRKRENKRISIGRCVTWSECRRRLLLNYSCAMYIDR